MQQLQKPKEQKKKKLTQLMFQKKNELDKQNRNKNRLGPKLIKEIRKEEIKVNLASEADKQIKQKLQKKSDLSEERSNFNISSFQLSKSRFQEHIFKENVIRDKKSRRNFVRQLEENYLKLIESKPSLSKQMVHLSIIKSRDSHEKDLNSSGDNDMTRRVTDLDLGNFRVNETLGKFNTCFLCIMSCFVTSLL
jgi:hypothetical protein